MPRLGNILKSKPSTVSTLALIAAVAVNACGGGGDPAPPRRLARITVTPDEVTLEAIDTTTQLQATAQDGNGNTMAATFNWTSANTAVATVDTSGLVTVRANGMTTVTVASGSVTASVPVTVEQRLTDLVLPINAITLDALGATAQLDVTAQDANGHPMSAELAWDSTDPTIATVDAGGLITAQGNGMTTVTATSGSVSTPVAVTVDVVLIARIVISPGMLTIEALGDSAQLVAEAQDGEGMAIAAELGWASSDTSIATVDTNGWVAAKGNGTATITASAATLSASATVNVNQKAVYVDVQPGGYALKPLRLDSIGATIQFTAVAQDSNGHPIPGFSFTPRSSDADVVVIDENLVATATGNGRAAVAFATVNGALASVWVHQRAVRMQTTPAARTFRRVNETHTFTADAWDANGHPLPAEFFAWESTDQRVAVVDDTGLVRIEGNGTTEITLSAAESSASASATVFGELEVACATGPRTPSITTVEPESLVEGASIVIEGSGFCIKASGSLVTIDGVVANVESASETMLQVRVPQFCRPARAVDLTVAVGGNRATRPMELRPDETTISLPVGQQIIVGAGADRCLQFAEADGSEAYLIGVQSTTLLPESDGFTGVRVIATTHTPETEPSIATVDGWADWSPSDSHGPVASDIVGPAWDQWPDAPPDVQWHDSETAQSFGYSRALGEVHFPGVGDVDALPEVGDVVTLYNSADEWLVHTIGEYGLWLIKRDEAELFEAAYAGLIEQLSDDFDADVYPIVTDYFGLPELGNTGRVVFTVPEYGRYATFFIPGDRTWQRIELPLNRTFVFLNTDPPKLGTLAHELTHAIQYSVWRQRLNPNLPWFHEGQAVLGSQIFLFHMLGWSSGQNYGQEKLRSRASERIRLGGGSLFAPISGFFGGPSPRTPQECSWLVTDEDRDRACGSKRFYYEMGWSFLTWLTDQYGTLYPGGERHLHQELIQAGNGRFETIERLLGETMETLLGRWAAALYVDDRIADADPTLQFTSWNLHDIIG